MVSIERCPAPADAMLNKYSMDRAYVDCYRTEVRGQVSFPEFIFAFYTTPLFKVERVILQYTVSKPSTDIQARQLANGTTEKFAAWHVEGRRENELLMCDFGGRTRSWLMVVPMNRVSEPRTRLYFGSAVVPVRNPATRELSLEFVYQALLGFHKIYSIMLLYSAKSKITRQVSRAL